MRASVKRTLGVASALALAAVLVGYLIVARDPLASHPALTLTADDNWPHLPPGVGMGQATGLAVDPQGRVFVFHRAGRQWVEPFPSDEIAEDTVFVFDGKSGALLARWGAAQFIMPHGLALDARGDVWVTDVGAQQVRKFSAGGKPLLTLGERGVKGSDAQHFALPTDVAFGPDGTVYVSDGYENTRVVRFSPDGRYLGEWGGKGMAPGRFDLPHGVAVGSSGRVYVADRGNARLQVFDSQGKFLATWNDDRVGRPYGVDVASDGSLYIVDGGNQPWPTRSRVLHVSADGRVLGVLETRQSRDKAVLGHAIAVAPDGTVYVADAWADRVRRLVPTAKP